MAHPAQTYGGLQASIKTWCARNDTDFVAQVPEFIHMGEQRIFYGSGDPHKSDPVRIRDMVTTADINFNDTGAAFLPDDFLDQISLTWNSDFSTALRYLPSEEYHALNMFNSSASSTDVPSVFTVDDNAVLVKPIMEGPATFVHYARFPTLVNDVDTNDLLLGYPSIYLKAALIEAYGFIRNRDERTAVLAEYVAAANGISAQTRTSLQPARFSPTIPGADAVRREIIRG